MTQTPHINCVCQKQEDTHEEEACGARTMWRIGAVVDPPEGQGAVSLLLPVGLHLLGGQDGDIIIVLQIL